MIIQLSARRKFKLCSFKNNVVEQSAKRFSSATRNNPRITTLSAAHSTPENYHLSISSFLNFSSNFPTEFSSLDVFPRKITHHDTNICSAWVALSKRKEFFIENFSLYSRDFIWGIRRKRKTKTLAREKKTQKQHQSSACHM